MKGDIKTKYTTYKKNRVDKENIKMWGSVILSGIVLAVVLYIALPIV